MKKYLLLILIPLFFFSCGQGNVKSNPDSKEIDSTAQSAVQEVKKRPESPKIKSITRYKTSPEDAEGSILSTENYDENGLRTEYLGYDYYGSGEQTDKTTFEYDDKGQKIKSVQESSGQVTTETYTYDEEGKESGQAWSRPDGKGASESNVYNAQGDVQETKYYDVDGKYDFSRVYEYTYDQAGNITEEKKWEKYTDGSADLLMYHQSKTYNAEGKVLSETDHRGDGAISGKDVIAYDAQGNMVEKIEYASDESVDSREVSEYNEYGELIKDQAFSGMDVLNYTNTYTYDEYGHQLSMMYKHEDGEAWGERTVYTYYE